MILLLAVPRRLFCFGSLVNLNVVCHYLSLFLFYVNLTRAQHAGANAQLQLNLENSKLKKGHNFVKKI